MRYYPNGVLCHFHYERYRMSRHHRKTPNRSWALIRQQVLDRDKHRCRECGKAGRLEAHHVLELQDGGSNDLDNLSTLCRGCHIRTHARRPTSAEAEWLALVAET